MSGEFSGPSAKSIDARKKTKRPTEFDFVKKIEGYLFLLQHDRRGKYLDIKVELEDMASGKGDPNVREGYYSGWTDEDFREVLRRLTNMERQENDLKSQKHTRWAKQRALEILQNGDLQGAIDSMVSDLAKDTTRSREVVRSLMLFGMILRNDPALDQKKVREFIVEFVD